ncbi:MAG: thiamine pyrophosphate-dependent dehydrogenase E1 component subunit alpha [Holophagaceae bacterium]|nr:thiamine pyrophosphate-dependent dehydrogenase E1 component subunit alpha [Holophagaceae bacterium]
MQLTRLVEERLVGLFRQGHTMGSVYRSLGQEAVACATALALGPEDVIGPMIRNLGSMLARGATPKEIFLQYLGRATGPSGGREHNNHFGGVPRGIIAPTSMLGALVPVMAGAALSFKQKKEQRVAMTWIGDGGSSTGAFSEGLNFAVVQNLPLIVVGELNGFAYSTSPEKQMKGHMSERSQGAYTMVVDGNNSLEVLESSKRARQICLEGDGPVFLVCETFRMKGHAEHDDQRYVDPDQLARWAKKDPIAHLEAWLRGQRWLPEPEFLQQLNERVDREAEEALSAEKAGGLKI